MESIKAKRTNGGCWENIFRRCWSDFSKLLYVGKWLFYIINFDWFYHSCSKLDIKWEHKICKKGFWAEKVCWFTDLKSDNCLMNLFPQKSEYIQIFEWISQLTREIHLILFNKSFLKRIEIFYEKGARNGICRTHLLDI